MFDQMLFATLGWVFHAILAGVVIVGVAYLGRGRIEWEPWEFTVVVVPFAVWLVLTVWQTPTPKHTENLVLEPCILAAGIALATVLRGALATHWRQDRVALYCYFFPILCAMAIWRFMPTLTW